jgi:hypothetical protein
MAHRRDREYVGFMRRLALAAVVLAVFALPASAGASTTFGANLNRVPNNPSTCGSFDPGPAYGYAPGTFDTCSWDFNDLATGESVFPPVGQGVISRVRVRVGPTTGPMQVVVEQALRKDNPGDPGHPTYACCQAVQLSQVFTPAANAVTTVPVNLSVRQDIAPDPASGYYVDQHLALSVLARNVPIPASSDSNASLTGWFPAWRSGDERAGGYGTAGYVILFNADWDPAGAGSGGGGGGDVPGIDFGRVRALGDGTARLPITLPGPGLLRITDDRATAAAKRKPKARVKGIRRNIKKAGKVTVRIRPSKAGKRTLRRKHKLKVKLRVTFTPSGAKSSAVTTKTLTLKLKRRRR